MTAETEWFRPPGGGWVDLRRRDTLRRVLHKLVEHRLRRPRSVLTHEALLAAGWPAEIILPVAGLARVKVALSTLRRLGLSKLLLVRRGHGYLLDSRVRIVVARRFDS